MIKPGWTALANAHAPGRHPIYTRPLLGSELFADQVMLTQDGFGECCMGITFTTALASDELQVRTEQALLRLRFDTPITAATLESGIHDPQLRSWLYKSIQSPEELHAWVSEILTVLHEPVNPSQFVQEMNATKLSYTLPGGGRSQYLRLYLVRSGGTMNTFGLFFHGTHALMDAHPTIITLGLLLDYMTSTHLPDVTSLQWGTEWKNPPAWLVTSTGGRHTDVRSSLAKITVPGRPMRLLVELTLDESAGILQGVKQLGFTSSHLLDAATALATFTMNPISAEESSDAHVTFGSSLISLGRYLVPPHSSKGHFISRFVLVPISIPWKDVSGSQSASSKEEDKRRLLAAMARVKEQYAEYLDNPCTPQLMAEQMRLAPPREGMPITNPYVSTRTNLGNVERLIPMLWPTTPLVQLWTMHSRISVQIEAADSWDEKILKEFMNEIMRFVLTVTT